MKAFIASYSQKHNGSQPSVSQIRSRIHNSHREPDGTQPLNDFVYQLGVDLLKYVGSQSFHITARLRQHNPASANESATTQEADTDLLQKMNSAKAKGQWPLKSGRLSKFHKDKLGFLQRLRKHKSLSFHHTPVKNELSSKGEVLRSTCPLCCDEKRSVKRQTRYKCSTCEVPLCCTAIGDRDIDGADKDITEATAKSCFALWHECTNLVEMNKKQNKRLVEFKQSGSRKRARDDDESLGLLRDDDNSYSYLNNGHEINVLDLPGIERGNNDQLGSSSPSHIVQDGLEVEDDPQFGEFSPPVGESASQIELRYNSQGQTEQEGSTNANVLLVVTFTFRIMSVYCPTVKNKQLLE